MSLRTDSYRAHFISFSFYRFLIRSGRSPFEIGCKSADGAIPAADVDGRCRRSMPTVADTSVRHYSHLRLPGRIARGRRLVLAIAIRSEFVSNLRRGHLQITWSSPRGHLEATLSALSSPEAETGVTKVTDVEIGTILDLVSVVAKTLIVWTSRDEMPTLGRLVTRCPQVDVSREPDEFVRTACRISRKSLLIFL